MASQTEDANSVTSIRDLRPEVIGVNVTGLVICKTSLKQIKDTRSTGNNAANRCVMSFSVRDKSGCINCSVWGNEPFVFCLCQTFRIGDTVIITNGQTTLKGPSDEMYNPSNASAFSVTISEKQGGNVVLHEDQELRSLLHSPIRPNSDFYTITDIFEQSENMEGQFVNLLAVVKKVSNIQHLTTKNGKELEKMEVSFFDNTADSFAVIVWEREFFDYIQNWVEKRSVIFAADVRLTYNKYKNCMQGTFNSKTICVRDPDTSEAHQLYDYALEYADQMEELFGDSKDERDSNVHNLDESELRVYTIGEIIKEQMNALADSDGDNKCKPALMRGILQAAITNFNVDDRSRRAWCYRCSACRYRLLDDSAKTCINERCVTKEDPAKFSANRVFDMQIALTDHTGTLDQCKIGGSAIEKMFGLTVDGFECLSNQDLTDLKWTWLMERCRIRFRFNFDHPASRLRIEMCEKPDLERALSTTNTI